MAQLLFDLDGTLTDPGEGITRCIQHALSELGAARPPRSELERFIGPPLSQAFRELLSVTRTHVDEGLVECAIDAYRDRYRDVGIYENQLYAGIPEALAKLRASGHRLRVVTSKPAVFAERVIDHFSLGDYFDAVHGSELDGRRSGKVELLGWVLASEELEASDAVMVGDREHDVMGARANALRSVGVTWGYGSLEELRAAGPTTIVDSVDALVDWSLEIG